jgi:hypothetical protein
VVREGDWQGGHKWILNPCPFNEDHTDNSAHIVRHPSGGIAAGCHHKGCQGNDWHTLRDLCEPGWQERREGTRQSDDGTSNELDTSGAFAPSTPFAPPVPMHLRGPSLSGTRHSTA